MPRARKLDSASEAVWLSEKRATKSKSSELAMVLIAASSANSRSTCLDLDRKGASSSRHERKTTQIVAPTEAICCWTSGLVDAAATAMVSSAIADTLTAPKRRSTIAKGCGRMRYDQLSSASAPSPSP